MVSQLSSLHVTQTLTTRFPFSQGLSDGAVVKNLPAEEEDARDVGVIPGWEDALEEEMATHSSILARKIPQTEEPGGLQFKGDKESDMTKRLSRQAKRQMSVEYVHT